MNKIFKGRMGARIEINNKTIILKQQFLSKEIFFNISDISSISISRSIYDIPFLEKTIIFLVSGKKYKIKRFPVQLINEIKELIFNK